MKRSRFYWRRRVHGVAYLGALLLLMASSAVTIFSLLFLVRLCGLVWNLAP